LQWLGARSRFEAALAAVSLQPELKGKLLQLATVLDTLLDLQDERSRLAPSLRADQEQLGMALEFDPSSDRAIRDRELEVEVHARSDELRMLAAEVIQRMNSANGEERDTCLHLLGLLASEAVHATAIVEKLKSSE